MEHFELQGYSVFGSADAKSPLAEGLGELSQTRQKSLAGNGMHVQVVGSVIAFVLACTQRA